MVCSGVKPISSLRPSSPQVTYRVVQVTDEQIEAATQDGTGAVSVVSAAAFTGAPQAVAQVYTTSSFHF